MKIILAISTVALLLTGCAQPQYTYYQPQPVYYQAPVYVAPRPYYGVRCYWTQRYVPQYNVYRSVRVCM